MKTDIWINRIENPEINPYTYGQLIFNKQGKNIQWEKRQSLEQGVLGNLGSCMLINKMRTHPHTVHKKKFKVA